MTPLTKIAALRALCEKATAEKWLVLQIPDQPPIVAASCGAIVCRPPAPRDIRGTWDADAALIAELRNALPALLAVAEAAAEVCPAVEVNDRDTIARLKKDDEVIWLATGCWEPPQAVTLGDLRRIRTALGAPDTFA